MADTLRAVDTAADLSPDDKVRYVAKMLLRLVGMTTLELGTKLGLGRTAIYDRTQGRTPFTVAEVVRMADIFGLPPEAFLAGPHVLIRPNIAGSDSGSIKTRRRGASVSPHVATQTLGSRPRLSLVA